MDTCKQGLRFLRRVTLFSFSSFPSTLLSSPPFVLSKLIDLLRDIIGGIASFFFPLRLDDSMVITINFNEGASVGEGWFGGWSQAAEVLASARFVSFRFADTCIRVRPVCRKSSPTIYSICSERSPVHLAPPLLPPPPPTAECSTYKMRGCTVPRSFACACFLPPSGLFPFPAAPPAGSAWD